MFKFLLITAIVVYLIYKVGSFFFRIGAASQNIRRFHEQQTKAGFNPKSTPGAAPESKVKGGEYIDYEEVK